MGNNTGKASQKETNIEEQLFVLLNNHDLFCDTGVEKVKTLLNIANFTFEFVPAPFKIAGLFLEILKRKVDSVDLSNAEWKAFQEELAEFYMDKEAGCGYDKMLATFIDVNNQLLGTPAGAEYALINEELSKAATDLNNQFRTLLLTFSDKEARKRGWLKTFLSSQDGIEEARKGRVALAEIRRQLKALFEKNQILVNLTTAEIVRRIQENWRKMVNDHAISSSKIESLVYLWVGNHWSTEVNTNQFITTLKMKVLNGDSHRESDKDIFEKFQRIMQKRYPNCINCENIQEIVSLSQLSERAVLFDFVSFVATAFEDAERRSRVLLDIKNDYFRQLWSENSFSDGAEPIDTFIVACIKSCSGSPANFNNSLKNFRQLLVDKALVAGKVTSTVLNELSEGHTSLNLCELIERICTKDLNYNGKGRSSEPYSPGDRMKNHMKYEHPNINASMSQQPFSGNASMSQQPFSDNASMSQQLWTDDESQHY